MLKKTVFGLLFIMVGFIIYVIIANRNSKNMTVRQQLLKAVYPILMWYANKKNSQNASIPNSAILPIAPIYSLPAIRTDGIPINLNDYRGKKILLVNTASNCGYTRQYEALEKLYQLHKNKLVILAFPSNDFKEQEKEKDEDIATFCKLNFGITFPLLKKSKVVKGLAQNEIFDWLTHKNKNGWNDRAPSWNFCKYLVNEQGQLVHLFTAEVEPLGSEIQKAINE